jgi:hypothetical protein
MKMTVFWDVEPCSLAEVDDISEVLTAAQHQGNLPDYTAQLLRRLQLFKCSQNGDIFYGHLLFSYDI